MSEQHLSTYIGDADAADLAPADQIGDIILGLAIQAGNVHRDLLGQAAGYITPNVIIHRVVSEPAKPSRYIAARLERRIRRDDVDPAAGRVAPEHRSLQIGREHV